MSSAKHAAEKLKFRPLLDAYVGALSGARAVTDVIVTFDGAEPIVWTVLDAPPWDRSCRRPVYEAQIDVMPRFDEVAEFRVVNPNEVDVPLAELRREGWVVLGRSAQRPREA